MESNNKKLEICEVCNTNKAKFTCPKCEVRTCTLDCVKIHKKELECDGMRDKTKYIPLYSFTDLDFLSDYRLLEEIGKYTGKIQENRSNKFRQQELPRRLHVLKLAAHKRGINLEFMPKDSSRSRENSTYCHWKHNILYWTLKIIFPQAENTEWTIKRVEETKRMSNVLEEILNPLPVDSKDEELSSKLTLLQNKLKFYQACGLSGLKILLKAEKVNRSDSRFYELDLTQSLQENFKSKTIIEYPIIYVIQKDHSDMFEVIESDDDNEEVQSSNIKVEPDCEQSFKPWHRKRKFNAAQNYKNQTNPHPHSLKSTKTNKSDSVNYFFNEDLTDSEDEEKMVFRKNNQELNIPYYDDLVKKDDD